MKEIGGYLGLEQLVSHEYHEGLVAVNNARNALLYLIRAREIRKLYIPYFLCDSVSLLCQREGCPFAYYHIDGSLLPLFDHQLAEGEYLYVVNYYGQISNEQAQALQRKHSRIIFDNVQAFFQKPVSGIDTVYSCRKFFGVPDGGYVATDADYPGELPEDRSRDRMTHILGRFEEGTASAFYADFKANDHSFVELELRRMSALTHNLLGAIDYEAARRRREENFAVLHAALGSVNPLKLTSPIGPYAYPFYCPGGMEVKKALAQKKIYVATLWPNVLSMEGSLEKDFAENILPLPCDQRYGREDMERIVRELHESAGIDGC